MKIAIIGSGGREHAIAWKLAREVSPSDLFVLPGNGGIDNAVPIDASDLGAIEAFCLERGVELVVVGPEAPLAAGIVERLTARGIRAFGPGRDAARLEASKVWAKRFMARHGIPTAEFEVCSSDQEALTYARELRGRAVVKYDGLAAGKGVFPCRDMEEVERALATVRARWGRSAPVLIERRLEGPELSVIGLTDGRTVRLLPPARDYKRAHDGDRGPNTGGMGALCPVPDCDEALLGRIEREVVEPTLRGLRDEGLHYCGVIYFGLMLTDEGPMVLEYNVRFGDPEAEVVLPAMESSLLALIMGCLDGSLDRVELDVVDGFFVDVVLASRGYPEAYERGLPISGLEASVPETLLFHAGTQRVGGAVVTAGGRVLNVVGHGPDIESARARAYARCEQIDFEGKVYRRDIAASIGGGDREGEGLGEHRRSRRRGAS